MSSRARCSNTEDLVIALAQQLQAAGVRHRARHRPRPPQQLAACSMASRWLPRSCCEPRRRPATAGVKEAQGEATASSIAIMMMRLKRWARAVGITVTAIAAKAVASAPPSTSASTLGYVSGQAEGTSRSRMRIALAEGC